MKKQFTSIALIIGILFSLICFTGCNDDNYDNDVIKSAKNEMKQTQVVIEASEINENERAYELKTCYKKDGFYVFQFYLGRVDLVPLQTEQIPETFYYDGVLEQQYSLSTATTSAESISRSVDKMLSKTVATEIGATFGTSITTSAGISIPIKKVASLSGSVQSTKDFSITGSISGEQTISSTNSYALSSSNSATNQTAWTFLWDKACPVGHYKYSHFGNFDVFALVIIDMETEEYSVHHTAILKSTTKSMEYSETSVFSNNSTDMLTFDESYLTDLVIPDNIPEFSEISTGDTQTGASELKLKQDYTNVHNAKVSINSKPTITKTIEGFDLAALRAAGYKMKVTINATLKGIDTCNAYFKVDVLGRQVGRSITIETGEDDTMHNLSCTIDNIVYDSNNCDDYVFSLTFFAERNTWPDYYHNAYLVTQIEFIVEFY